MTRKHDSMVSANNVPPPTENEAWRQHTRLHHPLHWYCGTVHVHLSRKIDQIPNVCHRTQWFHQNYFVCFQIFWCSGEMGKRVCGSFNEISTGGLALFSCFLPLWTLFCEGHQLMEIWPQYLAARPMCWTAGPALRVITPPTWSGNISGPVASGSTYLTEGILLRSGRYLNTSN